MSANSYHKRYHSDALAGFLPLSLEERGAYQTLLDMIYDRGGPVPDNDRLLAGYMQCSPRKWRTIRDSLIEKGKIRVTNDGYLTNDRAEKEIENLAKTSRKLAELGSKGGRTRAENAKKTNENSETDQAGLKPPSSHTRYQIPEKTTSSTRARDDGDLRRVCSAAGMSRPPRDSRLLDDWIAAGCDVDADILPEVERITERMRARGDPPSSFRLFDGDIRAAAAKRNAEVEQERARLAEIADRYPPLKIAGARPC